MHKDSLGMIHAENPNLNHELLEALDLHRQWLLDRADQLREALKETIEEAENIHGSMANHLRHNNAAVADMRQWQGEAGKRVAALKQTKGVL